MLVIPVLRRLTQEDLEFKASLSSLVRPCLKRKKRMKERKKEKEKKYESIRFTFHS
jgi:hypothetical protein